MQWNNGWWDNKEYFKKTQQYNRFHKKNIDAQNILVTYGLFTLDCYPGCLYQNFCQCKQSIKPTPHYRNIIYAVQSCRLIIYYASTVKCTQYAAMKDMWMRNTRSLISRCYSRSNAKAVILLPFTPWTNNYVKCFQLLLKTCGVEGHPRLEG